tara:strand:+ start:594 stop:755 length:162 start_codon:yes stop_codon:yes gene_type:complete
VPLTVKGEKTLKAMKKQYGSVRGEEFFYAGVNSGKLRGMEVKAATGKKRKKAS